MDYVIIHFHLPHVFFCLFQFWLPKLFSAFTTQMSCFGGWWRWWWCSFFQIGAGLYAFGRPVQKRNDEDGQIGTIQSLPLERGAYSTVFSVSRPMDPLMWLAGLLALSGDVETNPGPTTQTWTCDMCSTKITRRQTSHINAIAHPHTGCTNIVQPWYATLTTPLHGNATFTTNKTTRLLTSTINSQTTAIICNKIWILTNYTQLTTTKPNNR